MGTAKEDDTSQRPVTSFFMTNNTAKYTTSHAQQRAITKSLIEDLIVNCSLPVSIVKNPHFRHFMSVVDSRYTLPSRSTVASRLSQQAEQEQKCIIENRKAD